MSGRLRVRLVWLLLGSHLLWCAVRIPSRVFARRFDDIARHRQLGRVAFLFDGPGLAGADALQWLRQHAASDAVVLWRGESKGALEFAPALLWPRLVVAEAACPPGVATYAGRPLATRPGADGQPRVVVLEGLGSDLRLVWR